MDFERKTLLLKYSLKVEGREREKEREREKKGR